MTYGVVPTGFNVKRLADIKTDIETELRALFGDINLGPDSVFGQLVGAFAKPAADIWEKMEEVYYSQYPGSAESISLDNVVSINGLSRLAPSRTTVHAVCDGTQGTNVPSGTQLQIADGGEIFETLAAVTISKAAVAKALVTITQATSGKTYRITVEGTNYNYDATGLDSVDTIANSLKVLIDAGSEPVDVSLATGGLITIQGVNDALGVPTVFSVDTTTLTGGTPDGSPQSELTERWSQVLCRAIETGPILALLGTLTDIVTPVSGLDQVDNLIDGNVGSDTETDTNLRIRRKSSLQIVGAATADAIRARLLQEVEGVSAVIIFENTGDVPDGNNRPPHSFEAVVQGGLDTEVAQKIWDTKAAGIATTYGDSGSGVTETAYDDNGDPHDINFSRPVVKYGWVQVVITKYAASEEQYPVNGDSVVKQNIKDLGDTLQIGRDLTIQRWYGPIYEVPGIESATVQHAITDTEGGTPSYSGANLPVDSNVIVLFDLSRIVVTSS
jgi:uncharacterized phage protein gp47/JayE